MLNNSNTFLNASLTFMLNLTEAKLRCLVVALWVRTVQSLQQLTTVLLVRGSNPGWRGRDF